MLAVFLLYFVTGKIGLQLSSHALQVTLIWPPTVIALSFSLDVIAEGVESHVQSTVLIDLGCHLGQGYYFSHPMPADEFMMWFKKHHD